MALALKVHIHALQVLLAPPAGCGALWVRLEHPKVVLNVLQADVCSDRQQLLEAVPHLLGALVEHDRVPKVVPDAICQLLANVPAWQNVLRPTNLVLHLQLWVWV